MNNQFPLYGPGMMPAVAPNQAQMFASQQNQAQISMDEPMDGLRGTFWSTVGVSWEKILFPEFMKPYFITLCANSETEMANYAVYPPATDVFAWTRHCGPDDVKVVIIGQDPYPDDRAHGLSFSMRYPNKPCYDSLANIFTALRNEGYQSPQNHGDLTGWAKQGVLLLNSMLTVRAETREERKIPDELRSDVREGWTKFTDAVIERLDSEYGGIVFILWGTVAQMKSDLITRNKNNIITGYHPSPMVEHDGFFRKLYFSAANEMLGEQRKIDWNI